jgi:hypothetical protein
MTNQSNRSALFTSRDTEGAITFFTVLGIILIVVVFLHAKFLDKKGYSDAFYLVAGSMPHILASTTILTIFAEGADIMFRRYRAYREEKKKLIEKAREEGYHAGYQDGKKGVEPRIHTRDSKADTHTRGAEKGNTRKE